MPMARTNDEHKKIESWFLGAARKAGVPIPPGETPGEEPDFRFQTPSGALGIELTEVLRPASSNDGILPVEEESFHREVIKAAEQEYYAAPDALPVHVSVHFTNARGMRRSKRELSNTLASFVREDSHRAAPVVTVMGEGAPEGFDSIIMVAESNPKGWWSGEVGGVTLSDIRPQVEARISSKNKLVKTYRANLPAGANVWLLLYTGVTVARSMPIPRCVEDWQVPFSFDRVFWFASLEGRFAEIRRMEV